MKFLHSSLLILMILLNRTLFVMDKPSAPIPEKESSLQEIPSLQELCSQKIVKKIIPNHIKERFGQQKIDWQKAIEDYVKPLDTDTLEKLSIYNKKNILNGVLPIKEETQNYLRQLTPDHLVGAYCSHNKQELFILNHQKSKALQKVNTPSEYIYDVCFSLDKKSVALNYREEIRIYDLEKSYYIAKVPQHASQMIFSSNRSLFIASSSTLYHFDFSSSKEGQIIAQNENYLLSRKFLNFFPLINKIIFIILTGYTSDVKIVDYEQKKSSLIFFYKGSILCSADDKKNLLAIGIKNLIDVWNLNCESQVNKVSTVTDYPCAISALCFNPLDSNQLLAVTALPNVCIFLSDITSKNNLWCYRLAATPLTLLSWSEDGDEIIVAQGRTINRFDFPLNSLNKNIINILNDRKKE